MLALKNILLGLASVLGIVLETYFWVVIIACVLTWVGANPYNPIVRILRALTEPVFYKIRKLLPFVYVNGMDFSPIIVILAITFLKYALVSTIQGYALGL